MGSTPKKLGRALRRIHARWATIGLPEMNGASDSLVGRIGVKTDIRAISRARGACLEPERHDLTHAHWCGQR